MKDESEAWGTKAPWRAQLGVCDMHGATGVPQCLKVSPSDGEGWGQVPSGQSLAQTDHFSVCGVELSQLRESTGLFQAVQPSLVLVVQPLPLHVSLPEASTAAIYGLQAWAPVGSNLPCTASYRGFVSP